MSKIFSFVICTHNGQKYIREVLDSIIIQEGLDQYVDKIIVVDNASTDDTKEIITNYSSIHKIVEYQYEEALGLANARKHGALVDSEWVIFIDDDNLLMPEWIVNAKEFVDKNPALGVFNGASIPMLRHNITTDEKYMLKAIHTHLACTHYDYSSYANGVKSSIDFPFGAGMALKVEPLRKLLNAGWTKNIGRKGNEVSSGEDGEMAGFVLQQGYDYGYNEKSALWHIIPPTRLQIDYVKRLINGLNIGYYNYINESKNKNLLKTGLLIKGIIKIITYPIFMIFIFNKVTKIKYKISLLISMNFIKLIFNKK